MTFAEPLPATCLMPARILPQCLKWPAMQVYKQLHATTEDHKSHNIKLQAYCISLIMVEIDFSLVHINHLMNGDLEER